MDSHLHTARSFAKNSCHQQRHEKGIYTQQLKRYTQSAHELAGKKTATNTITHIYCASHVLHYCRFTRRHERNFQHLKHTHCDDVRLRKLSPSEMFQLLTHLQLFYAHLLENWNISDFVISLEMWLKKMLFILWDRSRSFIVIINSVHFHCVFTYILSLFSGQNSADSRWSWIRKRIAPKSEYSTFKNRIFTSSESNWIIHIITHTNPIMFSLLTSRKNE